MVNHFPAVLPYPWKSHFLLALFLLLTCSVVIAQSMNGNSDKTAEDELLDESEYRSELEEIVVIGRQPEWRQQRGEEEWRPERFELPEIKSEARLTWFPRYDKDERDQYDGVRDRLAEKPEFRLFRWRF